MGIRVGVIGWMLAAVFLVHAANAEAGGRRQHHAYTKPQLGPPSSTRGNPKYAALVVDTATGRILHQENAGASRYPASLTKMMTLYMVFDALEKGKLTLDKKLRVSAKAAGMPQTNIGLKKGDRIRVRDAIVSMVVRSANDSAVVVAEALGGTEQKFARMMTGRARQLGMEDTTFTNASGLPDGEQRSTARDMAKLAIALKRHFPQYYPHFKQDRFTYGGRTYTSHNRVMKRYGGADGIKTGYTRASGFNLVSSAYRNGHALVAVVMGGRSSASRDDHMIDLLDRSFASLNRPGRNWRFARLELPPENIEQVVERALGDDGSSLLIAAANVPVPQPRPLHYIGEYEEASLRPFSARNSNGSGRWGIQVGAFQDPKQALIAATRALDNAGESLSGSRIEVTGASSGALAVHRARLIAPSEAVAREACRTLLNRREPCFVYRTDGAF